MNSAFQADPSRSHDADRQLASSRDGEIRFRSLVEATTALVWTVDGTGAVVEANPSWGAFTGQSEAEYSGWGWLDAVHPDDRDHVAETLRAALANLSVYECEYRLRRADGEYRSTVARGVPIMDSDGSVREWIGTNTDIHDRRLAEDALRESETRFRNMADHAPVMIWVTDATGYCTYLNRAWYEFTGQSAEEALGSGWLDVTHPDDRTHTEAVLFAAHAAHEPFRLEYRVRHAGGDYRWVIDAAAPRFAAEGGFLGYVGSVIEIADRKLAEQRQAALVELGDRLRDLTDPADLAEAATAIIGRTLGLLRVGYAVMDGTAAIVERDWVVDANVARSTGIYRVSDWGSFLAPLRRGETVVVENVEGDSHTAASAAGWLGWNARAVAFVPLMEQGRLAAYIFLHSDKPRSWSREEIDFIRNAADRAWMAMRRVRAERTLRELNATLEQRVAERTAELLAAEDALRQAQKMEAVGRLTGGVAHDFNNLLTVIRSSVDLLRRHDLSEERRRRYIDAISDTADRAAKLTSQLLAFARRQPLKPEVFDVADRLRTVSDLVHTIVGSRIDIQVEIACGPCSVEADVNQFETALINLAVNARDAMGGEGRLTIGVADAPGSSSADGFIAISVTDTGSGIEPDRIDRIFEPFYTTKPVGQGTGLGLSQVYGFAKQSGGEVKVESRVGEGTAFILTLPRASTGTTPPESGAAAGQPTRTLRRSNVLVVEDDPEIGEFAMHLLRELGCDTTWAPTADAALALIGQDPQHFDIVFTDVVMPRMEGVALGHSIRERWPHLSVVLTSDHSEVLAQKECFGFVHLQKPYSAEALTRALHECRQMQAQMGSIG